MIVAKIRSSPAPSTVAASSISTGMSLSTAPLDSPEVRGSGGTVMSGFDVHPPAVAGLGRLMTRNGDAAGVFSMHLEYRRPTGLDEGLLGLLNGPLNRVQDLGEANSRQGRDLARAVGAEFAKAAEFYSATDKKHAGALDSTYPGATSTRIDRDDVVAPDVTFDEGPDPAADPKDPKKPYAGPPTDPGDAEVAANWPVDMEARLDALLGLCSVTNHIRMLLNAVTGADVLAEIAKWVGGDWTDLYRQAQVFEDTAFAYRVIRESVDRGRYLVQDHWEGNAASAAENWLAEYSAACAGHVEFMTEVSDQIKKFASAAYHSLVALNILVDTLLDTLVDYVTRGAGTIVAGAISVIKGENPLHSIVSILLSVSQISTVLDTIRGVAHGVAAILQQCVANAEVVAKTWPCVPYDHPAV